MYSAVDYRHVTVKKAYSRQPTASLAGCKAKQISPKIAIYMKANTRLWVKPYVTSKMTCSEVLLRMVNTAI
jgi:hypothetical protein